MQSIGRHGRGRQRRQSRAMHRRATEGSGPDRIGSTGPAWYGSAWTDCIGMAAWHRRAREDRAAHRRAKQRTGRAAKQGTALDGRAIQGTGPDSIGKAAAQSSALQWKGAAAPGPQSIVWDGSPLASQRIGAAAMTTIELESGVIVFALEDEEPDGWLATGIVIVSTGPMAMNKFPSRICLRGEKRQETNADI